MVSDGMHFSLVKSFDPAKFPGLAANVFLRLQAANRAAAGFGSFRELDPGAAETGAAMRKAWAEGIGSLGRTGS